MCTRILSRAHLVGPHRQVRSTARSASWSCERGLRCVGRSAGVGCVGRVSDFCLAASDGCVRAAAEGLFPRTVTCVSGRFRAGSNHRQRSIGRPHRQVHLTARLWATAASVVRARLVVRGSSCAGRGSGGGVGGGGLSPFVVGWLGYREPGCANTNCRPRPLDRRVSTGAFD